MAKYVGVSEQGRAAPFGFCRLASVRDNAARVGDLRERPPTAVLRSATLELRLLVNEARNGWPAPATSANNLVGLRVRPAMTYGIA